MADLRPSKATLSTLRAHVPDTGPNALRLELLPRGNGAGGMTLTFTTFLMAGAVPPYSSFLVAVLQHYGIRLTHLPPNSIIILSIFAYLCEHFLGVPPSLDLFRYYYSCRIAKKTRRHGGAAKVAANWREHAADAAAAAAATGTKAAIGSCFLRLRSRSFAKEFIHIHYRVCWRGWKDHWAYVEDGSGLDETALPVAPAKPRRSWSTKPVETPELAALRARVADLGRQGLTGAMVMAHAVKRRLSALRHDMRAFPAEAGGLDSTQIRACMMDLFGSVLETALPKDVRPLRECDYDPEDSSLRHQRITVGEDGDGGEEGDDAAADGSAGGTAEVARGKRPLVTTDPKVSQKAPRSVSTSSPAIATTVVGIDLDLVLSSSQSDSAPMVSSDHPGSAAESSHSQSGLAGNVGGAAAKEAERAVDAAEKLVESRRVDMDNLSTELRQPEGELDLLSRSEAERAQTEIRRLEYELAAVRGDAQRATQENRRLEDELGNALREAQRLDTENRRLRDDLEKARLDQEQVKEMAVMNNLFTRHHGSFSAALRRLAGGDDPPPLGHA